MNLTLGRSHTWVPRGTEYIERRPMNWGKNLTVVGAITGRGWLTVATVWNALNAERFVDFVRRRQAPKLRRGQIVLMDNVGAHKDRRVRELIEVRGARLKMLPPYSPDFNPIESAWGLLKQRLKQAAPRAPDALRAAVRRARHVVQPRHCKGRFTHCGYRQFK